jgi:chemotaxis protein MotB
VDAAEAVSHERWLISYSDFMTLLFAFFVVLFAATYRDNQTIRRLARAIHHGFQTMGAFSADEKGSGVAYSTSTAKTGDDASRLQNDPAAIEPDPVGSAQDMLQLRRQLEAAMGSELKNHEIVLQVTPAGFVISLKELGFFNSGQAGLLPGAGQKIARIAKVLERPGLDIRVEGHSDNQPIHTAQYRSNWELSTARAMTVLQLLVDDGFDPKKLSAAGYGEFRPIADNATPEGRRMNRRVDLVVVQARSSVPVDPSAAPDGKNAPAADSTAQSAAK